MPILNCDAFCPIVGTSTRYAVHRANTPCFDFSFNVRRRCLELYPLWRCAGVSPNLPITDPRYFSLCCFCRKRAATSTFSGRCETILEVTGHKISASKHTLRLIAYAVSPHNFRSCHQHTRNKMQSVRIIVNSSQEVASRCSIVHTSTKKKRQVIGAKRILSVK